MDIGAYNFSGYPCWMYHATELPKQVTTPAAADELLAQGWSKPDIVHDWPKLYYGPNGEMQNVASPEDAAALPPGWSDTPPVIPDVPPVSLNPVNLAIPAAGGDGTLTVTITGTRASAHWT